MLSLYTLSEAAARLGIPEQLRLVKSLIARHEIATTRVGRCVVIDRSGFLRLKAAHRAWVKRPRPRGPRPRQSIAN